MNRWHVYNFMKQAWYETGKVVDTKSVVARFRGMDMQELREGMIEFRIAHERIFSKETGWTAIAAEPTALN